mgnify:CR=1 FL=1
MSHILFNVIKRFFDIISSLFAIVITLPLWLLIAAGIKLSSAGPVFYKAERVGKNRKNFILYKFRSMHVYHPEEGSNKTTEGGYIANENRIFKFGGFLRKSKLDELPQLLNVISGEMSVVGPRPITKAGVAKHYSGAHAKVMTVKPGLACLDSLFDYAHGELFIKNEEEFDKKISPVRDELADMYVTKQSIMLDLYCIYRTISLIIQIGFMKKKNFPYTEYEKIALRKVFGRL